MPGCGRRRKTKSRFSIAAHEPLEIAGPRFPHSRSPGHYRHGKVEIQTQDSHFPTAHSSLKIKNERRTQPPPVTLVFRLISGLENAPAPVLVSFHIAVMKPRFPVPLCGCNGCLHDLAGVWCAGAILRFDWRSITLSEKNGDQGGHQHSRCRLIRMPPRVWGCASSRLKR
jgi:hypothetical protein